MKFYQLFLKRKIDIAISIIALIMISPFLIFVSLILFILNKKKVFYLQPRPGLNGKVFKVIKFKTMNDKCDLNGCLLPDKYRITTFGRLIRSLSIDELPQFVNVLKGDMSLVGPRPLLLQYISHYSKDQATRHNVRPGITGWAQINGRNAISWDQKFNYDIWYVNNISFLLDLKIIFLTFKKVLFQNGINSSQKVTMEPFTGNTK